MATKAYFAAFVTLHAIVTRPGKYMTRGGELVAITVVSSRHDFGCKGEYPCAAQESWHKSGRLYAGRETMNDIVRAA